MNKWKLYNPGGMQDILKSNCYKKRNAEEKLRSMYQNLGFIEIETPIIEYYDVFKASGSETAMNSPFKMVDEKGRILTLRPDMTIPSARVACTKLKDEDLPAKFFYSGKCFRNAEFNGGHMREFTQSGAEIIGSSNLFYDGLMIATAVNAMKTAGLDEFIIELGQVQFFIRLMEMAAFNEDESEKIRLLVDSKDFFGVEEMLMSLEMESEVKNILLNLPNFYGKKEMFQEVRGMTTDLKLLNVLDQLEELLAILENFKVLEYISVDLGMVPRLDYYTGIIYRGMTYGLGYPVLGGGRYNTLCGKFGKPMPATGFSLGVDRVLAALYRKDEKEDINYAADSIVCFEDNSIKEALMVSESLKEQGLKIETAPLENGLDNMKLYAAAKGIKGIIFVKKNRDIKVIDLVSDTEETTDIKTLTGGRS